MESEKVIKTRRSIRDYKDVSIPRGALRKMVDAARFAATARGVQPWEFVIITDPGMLNKLADLAENARFLAQAKACIAVFSAETKYYLEDGCAATENILLSATDQGIGSCWVAGDKKPYCSEVAKILGVPEGLKLVSMVSLGYPKSERDFKVAEKRELDDVLHWESF